jgi:hypothetical protein
MKRQAGAGAKQMKAWTSLMKTSLRVVCFLTIGVAVSIVLARTIEGTPEIAQREGQGCLACHKALGRADLNDRGLYYKAERTLEGYRDPEASPTGEPPRGAEPSKAGERPPDEPRPAPEPATEAPRSSR